MSHPAWSIDGDIAALAVGSLTARVALRSPQHGVHDVVHSGTSLDGAQLLCITAPAGAEQAAVELEDAYVRQHDLVVDYALRPLGLKLRVYWAASCDPESPDIVVLALTASLRTDLLDVAPTVRCHSTLPDIAVERLDNSLAVHSLALSPQPVDVSTSGDVSASGTVASLFSCAGSLVYAEMPHPSDVRRSSITRCGDTDEAVIIGHDLFTERLEKGVIVRGRILGLILPRDENTITRIGKRHQTFVAMDPPLDA